MEFLEADPVLKKPLSREIQQSFVPAAEIKEAYLDCTPINQVNFNGIKFTAQFLYYESQP